MQLGPPPSAIGATLYDSSAETTVAGTVREVQDFGCPVSEAEIGRHLLVQTARGGLQVHLIPARILRSQHVDFKPGDQIQVVGSTIRLLGKDGIIARELIRGNETFVLRDHKGNLIMQQ